MSDIPIVIADDDDGSGLLATFETPRGTPFLKVYGASVYKSGHTLDHGKLRITCRSKYQDEEGDYLYLLVADFIGTTEWIDYPTLEGVLTGFLWRTEEQALADKKEDGSYYWPKGPMREDEGYFHGKPITAIRCRITLEGRVGSSCIS